jgi:hypothetical protein
MLAGPRAPLSYGLGQVAAIAGTRRPVTLSRAMVSLTAYLTGPLGRVMPLPSEYAAESLRSSLATYYGTPAKAERELGWNCRGIAEGLRETIRSPA